MHINPENIHEWHDRYLNGALSDEERAHYEDWLATHPEARREREEWERLFKSIEQAGHEAMKQEIMDQAARLQHRQWPMLAWYRAAAILFFIVILPVVLIYSPDFKKPGTDITQKALETPSISALKEELERERTLSERSTSSRTDTSLSHGNNNSARGWSLGNTPRQTYGSKAHEGSNSNAEFADNMADLLSDVKPKAGITPPSERNRPTRRDETGNTKAGASKQNIKAPVNAAQGMGGIAQSGALPTQSINNNDTPALLSKQEPLNGNIEATDMTEWKENHPPMRLMEPAVNTIVKLTFSDSPYILFILPWSSAVSMDTLDYRISEQKTPKEIYLNVPESFYYEKDSVRLESDSTQYIRINFDSKRTFWLDKNRISGQAIKKPRSQ